MMKLSSHNVRGVHGQRGFSLVELMVVLVILGILGMIVGVYINTADAKLRSFAFNVGSRFKQAKYEAIKTGYDVYLDFDLNNTGTPGNGFSIWVDKDKDGIYHNGSSSPDYKVGEDVVLPQGVEIYDASNSTITGGPHDPADDPPGHTLGNGVSVNSGGVYKIKFTPGGLADNAAVYIYAPRATATGKAVEAGPWAIGNNTVGRIRLGEWKNGAWSLR